MAYTQSPHLTEEEIESLLNQAKVARFCNMNRDGTIHSVPVWYTYENRQIIIATPHSSRKARFDDADLQIEEFTHLCEKYILGGKAKNYAEVCWAFRGG